MVTTTYSGFFQYILTSFFFFMNYTKIREQHIYNIIFNKAIKMHKLWFKWVLRYDSNNFALA